MRISRYSKFILESHVDELINESKLIAGNNYKATLNAVKDGGNFDIYNLCSILLNMIDKDFDSPINYIDTTDKPGIVSFIPEDKIDYSDISIDFYYTLNKNNHKILRLLEIPINNLKDDNNSDNLKNSFKLVKKFDIQKIINNYDSKYKLLLNTYSQYIIYYLQNNEDENAFVALCLGPNSPSTAFINNKIPENRRAESRIGRVVTKMLDKFNPPNRKTFTSQVIEKFVNMFIACAIEMNESFDNFKIVDGEDIKNWYNVKNYQKNNGCSSGQLGNSCMRHEECQSYFSIYIKNPEVCKLLILLDKDKKLIGRNFSISIL